MPAAERKRTRGEKTDLRSRLEDACRRLYASTFGVVGVDEADALPTVRISVFDRESLKIRSRMKDAKSVVMYGILSTDDIDELSIRRDKKKNLWGYPGYMHLYRIQAEVVRVLWEEGFKAERVPYLVPLKRLGVLAGIGVIAKNSLLLSKDHGLWLRLNAVMTDAELPADRPYEGDLCGDCDLCVRACPTKALRPHVVNGLRCLVHLMEQDDPGELYEKNKDRYVPRLTPNAYRMCTACQMVCPYTSEERKKNVIERSLV